MIQRRRKRICVVGNFSGRNAGDAAILEGLLRDVHRLYPKARFLIPTINTKFVRRAYRHYPITPVPLLPWNLSFKIFGLPIFASALQSDLILITDAILFDRKLWNPLPNYLLTMSLVTPLADRKGIPVILYNGNLGPANTPMGMSCLRRVVQHSRMIIVRDPESISESTEDSFNDLNWE
jgi:polysaccharide pyruvyl transferase WcaK-like protein